MSFGKFIRVLLYLSTILGITLFITLSVDIYISVQFIAGSISLTSMIGLYAISLLSMYFSVSLFTFFDRAHSSKVVRKNIFHSTLYTVGIIFILSSSAYMQLSFINHTRAVAPLPFEDDLSIVWQMIVARMTLFALGSPFITYFTCILPTRHLKIILARGAQSS
ncbi:MAG: hypothetical protein OEX77_04570 [Candidatus Bathyarchaeota archaeon]|nr:hypothetical protein [Candidatus Bathyarchaeota archaeon]